MTKNGQPDRGMVQMNAEECKGCGLVRGRLPAQGPAAGGPPEPLRLPPGRVPGRRMHRLRHLLLRVSRARRHPGVAAGGVGASRMQQTTHQGQRSHRQGRGAGRVPGLLRLPHYAGQRNRRSRRAVSAAGRRRLRAGRKRSGRHQHAVRRRGRRRARHDRLQRARASA